MFRKLIVLFILLMTPIFVFAQSSGKIVGVINEVGTGEPLPGVNITLLNNFLGATTDIDGYFVILNVPVGNFDMEVTYIGYKPIIVEGIRVSADVTTEQNFELEPTTLELEEAIVVMADRPLVEKNVTSSISLVTAEDIESLPIRGMTNLIGLQRSVVVQDDQVYIRGSRDDEVGYYLNGASINNPLNNTAAVHVIQEAVEEFQVFAGGYTADFGGANGGIVRTELKSGTPKYHISADFQTDKFASEGEEFLGTSTYRYHNAVLTFSGPLVTDNIRFFLAGENTSRGDRQVRFSEGFRFTNLIDDGLITGFPDTVNVLEYPDGFTPFNDQERYALNSTLLFDYSPYRFRLGGAYTYDKIGSPEDIFTGNRPMLRILNDREYHDVQNSFLVTGKFTHVINPHTFYEVNLNYFSNQTEREDGYFGNDWRAWYDSTQNAAKGVTFQDRWTPKPDYLLDGFRFERPGVPHSGYTLNRNQGAFYRISKQTYYGGSVDFVSQFNKYNEVKIGGSFKYYSLRYFSIRPLLAFSGVEAFGGEYGENVEDYEWANNGLVDNYGYDVHGNEDDGSGSSAIKHPTFASFYLMDKIEYNDLIINAGLRFDYYDTDDSKLKDPADPDIDPNSKQILESALEELDPFMQISPRLGLSFPVSERTVFYAQYGKFIQMSEMNNIYFGGNRISRQMDASRYYGNVPFGFGLEPMRTTSYEVGFRQQLSEVAAFDISGFYKNIKGQISQISQVTSLTALSQGYPVLVNGDFATTKGLEFRLTMRRTNRLQATINYTLTDAQGSGSKENSYASAVDRHVDVPTIVSPLDFAQEHTGSIILDYRFGNDDGGPILENLGTNFLFTFSSGHPFTFVYAPPGGQVDAYTAGVDYMNDTRSRQALEGIGASTTPWTFNLDMRLDKTFMDIYEGIDATIYLNVQNLLNIKNEINVFERSGSASDDGFLSNPAYSDQFIQENGPQYADLYRAINLKNGQAYWDQIGKDLYGTPRQIWFGVKVTY